MEIRAGSIPKSWLGEHFYGDVILSGDPSTGSWTKNIQIMMYKKFCIKKNWSMQWETMFHWLVTPWPHSMSVFTFLPPGPVQRHSMARLSQWSIFKRGAFIFHTMTLAGARGSTNFVKRHWLGPGGRRNMMEDISKSLNRGTTVQQLILS